AGPPPRGPRAWGTAGAIRTRGSRSWPDRRLLRGGPGADARPPGANSLRSDAGLRERTPPARERRTRCHPRLSSADTDGGRRRQALTRAPPLRLDGAPRLRRSPRAPDSNRPDGRVGTIAHPELQPHPERVADLEEPARLPLRADADLLLRWIERGRGAVQRDGEPPHMAAAACGAPRDT